MTRRVLLWLGVSCLVLTGHVIAQDSTGRPPYLTWSAAQAERVGKALRVNGRVGGALDFRIVHTERSYNYKLRATWLSKEAIRATARLLQLSNRLTDNQTEDLVREATSAADAVILVEIDPREGSGVIPNQWVTFFGPAGNPQRVVQGVNTPALAELKALRGVYGRDYNYEQFWVVFSLKAADGSPLLPPGATEADLTVRIYDKEGQVTFRVPAHY